MCANSGVGGRKMVSGILGLIRNVSASNQLEKNAVSLSAMDVDVVSP
jgi:hypothetical protein